MGKVRQTNQSIGGFRRLDSSKDRHLHGLSGQGTHQIDVTRNRAHGESIDAVSVSGGVNRANGPGIAVVGHTSNLGQRGFGKLCVGDDNA